MSKIFFGFDRVYKIIFVFGIVTLSIVSLYPHLASAATTDPAIILTCPKSGDVLNPGQEFFITWDKKNVQSGDIVTLSLKAYDSAGISAGSSFFFGPNYDATTGVVRWRVNIPSQFSNPFNYDLFADISRGSTRYIRSSVNAFQIKAGGNNTCGGGGAAPVAPATPTFKSPTNGQTIDIGGLYTFELNSVSGATSYALKFFQDRNGDGIISTAIGSPDLLIAGGNSFFYLTGGATKLVIDQNNPLYSLLQAGSLKVLAWSQSGGANSTGYATVDVILNTPSGSGISGSSGNPPTTTPSIANVAITGGSCVTGSTCMVTWISAGSVSANTLIALFDASGTNFIGFVSLQTANDGAYSFTGYTDTSSRFHTLSAGNYVIAVYDKIDPSIVGSKSFSVVVSPPQPTFAVISPNGGEQLEQGKTYTISWNPIGNSTDDINAVLTDVTGIQVRIVSGTIVLTKNTGSVQWTVPAGLPIGSYKFYIQNITTSDEDFSDAPFNIVTPVIIPPVVTNPDLTAGNITFTPASPIAGDTLTFTGTIKVFGANDGSTKARFCIDNSSCSISTTGQVGGDINISALSFGQTSNQFTSAGTWVATQGAHTVYLCADVGGVVAESDETNNCISAPITINAAPTITISSVNRPTGEPTCAPGNPCTISWISSGASSKVNIYYFLQGLSTGTSIVAATPNNGSFIWIVPTTLSLGNYTVRVEDTNRTSVFGNSSQFSVVAPPASVEIVTAQALAPWQIDSSRIPFSITINNKGFLAVQGLGVQSWVEQGSTKTQNTGWVPQCPSQTLGTVPVGQCVSGAGQSTSLATSPGQPILGLGDAVWVIQLTDSNGALLVTKAFPITIVPLPSLTLIAPISADVVNGWAIGHNSRHTISWKSVGAVSKNVAIVLKKGGGTIGTILSPAANKDGSNTYQWTMDQPFFTIENGFQPGGGYTIQIFDINDRSISTESVPFSILEEPAGFSLDAITIAKQDQIMELENSIVHYDASFTNKGVRTVSGMMVAAHVEQTINGITAQGTLTEIPIECVGVAPGIAPHDTSCTSVAAGQHVSATSASGTLQPGPANVMVELKQGMVVFAKKSVPITLIPAPSITVQSSNGGEQWDMGVKHTIKWSTIGRVGDVDIKLKQVASGRCTSNCDVNGDGKSDAKDAQLIVEFNKYDLNNDNRVDRADLDILWNVNMGSLMCPTGKNCDVTGNNDVGNDDLFALMDYFRALYDANGDGKVNEADKVLLLNAILGLTTCNVNKICDYNMDGSSPDNSDLFTLMDFIDNSEYTLSGYRYDLNGDGKVTSADRDLVAAIAARTAICPDFSQIGSASKKCDIDGDGQIAGNDATTITAYLDRLGINQLHEGIIKSNIKNTNGGNYSKSASNKYDWYATDAFVAPGDNYKIEVYDSVDNDIIDESNGPFSITVPAPTIISPKKDQVFTIDNNLKIIIDATHPMLLTKYRIKIFQESQTFAGLDPNSLEAKLAGPANRTLLYESDPQLLDNLKFVFDRSLVRKTDKKPLVELLREGDLTISVEGDLPNGGFTPTASVTVKVKFDRTAPIIKNPKDREEINLGSSAIHVVATHKSNPVSYKVSLYQNSVLKYANDAVPAGALSLDFNIDANTSFQGKRVFETLDKGEVLLVVQGALFDGFTDEARRIFKVIPIPPSYDLNDDKKIDSQDLAILQSTIIYDAAYRKAIDESRPIPQYPSLATPCIQLVNAQGQSDPLGSPKKDCNFNKDFVTKSGLTRGMKIIDSRDAALLVAQPGYISGTSAPTLSTSGAPVIISPVAGTVWNIGAPQDVVIQPVAGATGYLVGFVRGSSLVFENYQNQRNLGTLNVSSNRVYKVGLVVNADGSSSIDSSFNKLFTAGSMNIYVRALVNNQWTEAVVVSITIQ